MARLILADLRERTRAPGFRFALLCAAYLAWSVSTGAFTFHWGEFRPVGSASWEGWNAGLFLLMFVSLPGFYFVKNAITTDLRTGAFPLLAASPTGNLAYVWSKVLANAAYLAALATTFTALVASFSPGDLGPFAFPLLLLVGPVLLGTVAAAACFEAVPWLRGSLGNVVYFVLWMTGVGLSSATRSPWAGDILAFGIVKPALMTAVKTAFPDAMGFWDMSLRPEPWSAVSWSEPQWNMVWIGYRLVWALPFVTLPFIGALALDRASDRSPGRRFGARGPAQLAVRLVRAALPKARPAAFDGFRRLRARCEERSSTVYAVLNEMTLQIKGHPALGYAAAAWLNIYAVLFAKAYDLRHTALPLLTLLPMTIWSGMGSHERRHSVAPILYATPMSLVKHGLTGCAAAFVTVLLMTAGLTTKALVLGDMHLVLVLLGAAALAPAAASVFGAVSGSRRLFEVVFLMAWYSGPVKDYYLYANLFFLPAADLARWLLVATLVSLACVVTVHGVKSSLVRVS